MNWLEVSLTVNGELAEAVAEVLARYAPNGVMTEQGVAFINAEEEGHAAGPITVRAYLPVDGQLEGTRRKLEESLFYLGMIQALPEASYRQIADQNWMEAWKEHYRPIRVGKRLLILPAWMESPEPGRVAIKIDPGMAFGTGTHPTTQLSLELIENFLKEAEADPLLQVIDVGCGSGILSIAAMKLRAARALGVDTDPGSIENARLNARLNDIGEEFLLGVGSVAEIRAGEFPITQAPLVVANILAPVLLRLLEAGLADLVTEGGALILSGILAEQGKAVLEAARRRGLKLKERRQMGDWVALALQR